MSESAAKVSPPYISFKTFLSLLDRLNGHMPQKIDRHYWGSFLGGSVGNNLMSGLRFLTLITDSNEPTDALAALAKPDLRKSELAALIKDRYSAAIEQADPTRTTTGHLTETFRKTYKIEGDTVRKAVAFFLHAWQHAELPLSPAIKTREGRAPTRRTTSGTSSRSATTRRTVSGQPTPPPPASRARTGQRQQDEEAPKGRYDDMMRTLIARLPPDGRWTQQMRERWIRAVAANIDLWIDVEDEPDEEEEFDFFGGDEEER
jgi:hypothetical protein